MGLLPRKTGRMVAEEADGYEERSRMSTEEGGCLLRLVASKGQRRISLLYRGRDEQPVGTRTEELGRGASRRS